MRKSLHRSCWTEYKILVFGAPYYLYLIILSKWFYLHIHFQSVGSFSSCGSCLYYLYLIKTLWSYGESFLEIILFYYSFPHAIRILLYLSGLGLWDGYLLVYPRIHVLWYNICMGLSSLHSRSFGHLFSHILII